jgi:dipeptidyl aminopeptidase/acylaminoacyl peptidase
MRRRRSSITFVQNVTTPAILFHGDDDWYSSYNQSLIFFTGIKNIGKAPVRFVSFPGRGHNLLDPWAQQFRYIEEIKWMQKYVQNIE